MEDNEDHKPSPVTLENPGTDKLIGRVLFGSNIIEGFLLFDSISSMFQGETLSGHKNLSDVGSHLT